MAFFLLFFLSLSPQKNVLLWKGLRKKKRFRWKRGHREEEGNDNDNDNNDEGCVGTRVIATREIRFLFQRTVRRRSRYAFCLN